MWLKKKEKPKKTSKREFIKRSTQIKLGHLHKDPKSGFKEKFNEILMDFIHEYHHIKQELTYQELSTIIGQKKHKKHTLLSDFLKKYRSIAFSEEEYDKKEFKKVIQEFKEILKHF